jgi:hypothetical protein
MASVDASSSMSAGINIGEMMTVVLSYQNLIHIKAV